MGALPAEGGTSAQQGGSVGMAWRPIARAASFAAALSDVVAQRVASARGEGVLVPAMAARDHGRAAFPGTDAPDGAAGVAASPGAPSMSDALPFTPSVASSSLAAQVVATWEAAAPHLAVPGAGPEAPVSRSADLPDSAAALAGPGQGVLARAYLASGTAGGGSAMQRAVDASWPSMAGGVLAPRATPQWRPGAVAAAPLLARFPAPEAGDATSLAELLSSRGGADAGNEGQALAAVFSGGGADMTPRLRGALAGLLAAPGQGGAAPSPMASLAAAANAAGTIVPSPAAGVGPRLADFTATAPEVAQGAAPETGEVPGEGAAPAAGAAQPNVDDLVNEVLSRVRRQLALEHERAGGFLPGLLR
jgi:hypothetical protein